MPKSIVSRFVLFAAAFLAFATSSGGQPAPEEGDLCASVTETYADYDARIATAKGELARLEQDSAAPDLLEAKRADLANLLFEQDCLRPDLLADPVRGPAVQPRWVTLTAYYATNRQAGPVVASNASYTGNRNPAGITFGKVNVSIPTQRAPGDLNLPLNLWLFELPADPSRHFIVKSVTPLRTDAAMQEMRSRLAALPRKRLLIFVHGYNVPFRDAALRTAQLAHDLNFPGLPMFFSWPSAGTTGGYSHDEEMSELSLGAFNALLNRVATLDASDVYIVAHSMGNRVVTRALAQRLASGRPVPANLKGLLLAAPDINADIFREQIAPGLAALSATRKTIYASNSDAALRASSFLHDFPRLGLTRPRVQTFAGWETVDATAAAPVKRGWGHSYVVDSPRVIRDMQGLIFQNLGAQQRGLSRTGTPPSAYWSIR